MTLSLKGLNLFLSGSLHDSSNYNLCLCKVSLYARRFYDGASLSEDELKCIEDLYLYFKTPNNHRIGCLSDSQVTTFFRVFDLILDQDRDFLSEDLLDAFIRYLRTARFSEY